MNFLRGLIKADRWEEYKKFFHITIFRYLVLWFSVVPVVAGLVVQLPSPLKFQIDGKAYEIYLSLPFHWQLLWVSSLFFVIALFIYALRCPRFIHKYNTYKDYESFSHDARWMSWEASYLIAEANDQQKDKLIKRLVTKKYLSVLTVDDNFSASSEPQVEEKQTVLYFEHNGKKCKLGMPVLVDDEIVQGSEKGVFYELFGRYSESRELERKSIKVLLVLSSVLFLVVFLEHLFYGLSYVYCWVKGMI